MSQGNSFGRFLAPFDNGAAFAAACPKGIAQRTPCETCRSAWLHPVVPTHLLPQ